MNKKPLYGAMLLTWLPLVAVAQNSADEAVDDKTAEELEAVVVEGTEIRDLSGRDVRSADLGEVLARRKAAVSLVRRSGIANDIILRGQKKDNINVLIDGGKIYGACPNRMDPPVSHVLTNNIEQVIITEGPYDVHNFGTLSGSVEIITAEPEAGLHGSLDLSMGSWNYLKGAATLSGGSDRVRALASISSESSDQYEDGDGHDFAEQIENYDPGSMTNYKPQYRDEKAYEKRTFMGKLYVDVTDNQELKLSYTANRSDDILYPSSPMDALYDDSDIFDAVYAIRDLGRWSRQLDIQYYHSSVEHPMSTYYRLSSGPDSMNEKTHYLETAMQGAKLKNLMDLNATTTLTIGLDTSKRNWDGVFEGEGMMSGIDGFVSIDDVDTRNAAVFAELNSTLGKLDMKLGARYDDTRIEHSGNLPDNDYSAFSAFVFGRYALDNGLGLFGGLGRSARVPDARELYITMPMMGGMLIGNPDLDQTTNTEIDLGLEWQAGGFYIKPRVFYSWLGDFIFYNDSKMMRRFENQDASLYGLSVDGNWAITDQWSIDFGLAWQRGTKDDPLDGQTDTDMPEIPPLKGNIALNWAYGPEHLFTAELLAADSWTRYDGDNGEQALDGWAILNLKLHHQFTDRIGATVGVDNVFDSTYAVSNTYKDLTLIESGGSEVILMNEPGRYVHANLEYRF